MLRVRSHIFDMTTTRRKVVYDASIETYFPSSWSHPMDENTQQNVHHNASILSHLPYSRSHRLTVRTPGFHPGNRSSILREITTKQAHRKVGFFRGALRSKVELRRSPMATEARRC
jgi:hypothetical protein